MSNFDDVAPVSQDNPLAHFRLDGEQGSYVELQVCPLHPGGVQVAMSDGLHSVVLEVEPDEVQAIIGALAEAHRVVSGG